MVDFAHLGLFLGDKRYSVRLVSRSNIGFLIPSGEHRGVHPHLEILVLDAGMCKHNTFRISCPQTRLHTPQSTSKPESSLLPSYGKLAMQAV
jgi:hypothetical protein